MARRVARGERVLVLLNLKARRSSEAALHFRLAAERMHGVDWRLAAS